MIMITLLLLSLGLAMDAFAAAVAQGASSRPNRSTALRMSVAFGLAQAIMPLLGWTLGIAFATIMASVAHWIALVLLGILGLRMIKEGLDRDPEEAMKNCPYGRCWLSPLPPASMPPSPVSPCPALARRFFSPAP
ncbi:hypothetical protein C8024_11100 [Sphingopyxis sp. BSNA05]|nr:manganese efflux pump [Sphingopyxis sp. BSNA05]NRD89880.1 hypothetical protein [Sphingopyxis sp. BSNA05]